MVTQKYKRITVIWIITVMILFAVSIIIGIIMRLNQGKAINLLSDNFYSLMTTHGLTMIGIWFVAGMAAVNYLLQRYVDIPIKINIFALVLTVLGVVILWVTTFIGNFHTGWTFLYPLPLYMPIEKWATPLFLFALGILGIGWFVWAVGMLIAIFKKYPLSKSLAWQHFRKKSEIETPPLILISVVTFIGIITCLITAVVLLILYFVEYFSKGNFTNDALLMKNLTYFFGHTLANEMLYLGVASLYEIMPDSSGRPKWKTTWYVALAWNATLFIVLLAFFHHLYMDFVQPVAFQMIGQIVSYLASLPAAAVTLFSIIVLVYKNPIRWTLINLLYFIGVMGWMIGGIGAVIDATIVNNLVLHNTLWVPAHFHTYNAMGNVLFSLAFSYWFSLEISNQPESKKFSWLTTRLLLFGGFGFVLMFYLGGAYSIPRRYNIYPQELSIGAIFASIGAIFATIYFIAVILLQIKIIRRCLKIFGS